jgi:hypothetical protein
MNEALTQKQIGLMIKGKKTIKRVEEREDGVEETSSTTESTYEHGWKDQSQEQLYGKSEGPMNQRSAQEAEAITPERMAAWTVGCDR